MGLDAELESFAAEHGTRGGTKCRVCVLGLDVRSAISHAGDKGIAHTTIAAWLKSKGYEIGDSSVGNHLRKHVKR